MYIPIWLIILTVVLSLLFYKSKQKQEEFVPIRINILPKWSELFKDYKIANDNSWDSKVPEDKEYHILKHGINFTILKPGLIYDDDRHHFKTAVDFRRKIDEVSPDKYGTDFVGVYVKSSLEGYEVGIRTPESHEKSFKERGEYKGVLGDDSDLIKIATIPYTEFYIRDFNKKRQKQKDQNLQKHGWKREEPDAEFSLVDSTITIEHKYFLVFYEYI